MEGAVTVDDILDELADYLKRDVRLPSDIDAKQIAENSNPKISDRQGLNRLKRIAKERADFEAIKVYDPESCARCWVLRKVT